jgi:hypothetical protein
MEMVAGLRLSGAWQKICVKTCYSVFSGVAPPAIFWPSACAVSTRLRRSNQSIAALLIMLKEKKEHARQIHVNV